MLKNSKKTKFNQTSRPLWTTKIEFVVFTQLRRSPINENEVCPIQKENLPHTERTFLYSFAPYRKKHLFCFLYYKKQKNAFLCFLYYKKQKTAAWNIQKKRKHFHYKQWWKQKNDQT